MAIPTSTQVPSTNDPAQSGQDPNVGSAPVPTPVSESAMPATSADSITTSEAAEAVVPVTPVSEPAQPNSSGPVTVEPTANMQNIVEDAVDPNAALKDGNPQVVEGETNPEKIQKEEVLQKIATDTPGLATPTGTLPPMPESIDEKPMGETEEMHKTVASDNLIPPSEIDAASLEMKPEENQKMEEQAKESVATTTGAIDQSAKSGGSNFAFKLIILVLVLAILATIGFVAYTLLV